MTDLKPVSLHTCSATTTWAAALAKADELAGGEPLFALCYAREEVILGRVEHGQLLVDRAVGKDDPQVEPFAGAPFEARLFGQTFELRWREAIGKAALLTECQALANRFGGERSDLDVTHMLALSYLLWGSGVGASTEGWSRLGTARIGAYGAPLSGIGNKEHIHLHAVEYLTADGHGNVHPIAERLSHLAAEAAGWVAELERSLPGTQT
jgi:CRISPR-associated protein (TIGR03984 family)